MLVKQNYHNHNIHSDEDYHWIGYSRSIILPPSTNDIYHFYIYVVLKAFLQYLIVETI